MNLCFECYDIELLKNIVVFLLVKFFDGLIHVSGCNVWLNLLYNDSNNDRMFFSKEQLMFRGFRDEK